MRCRDILAFSSLKQLKLLAGKNGLDREIKWTHVLEIEEAAQFVQGGELLFTTGVYLQNDTQKLTRLIGSIQEKKVAGLVINIGPYFREIPSEAVALADELDFPLFELPWDVLLVDVTREICSALLVQQMEERSIRDLLEDLFFGSLPAVNLLLERARFYGYDLELPHGVLIVDLDHFARYLEDHQLKNEEKILGLKSQFYLTVQEVLKQTGKKILSMLRSDAVIILLPAATDLSSEEIKHLAAKIQRKVAEKLKGITVSIGIGKNYGHIQDFRKSFTEAELAIHVTKMSERMNCIMSYEELGVYQLLFQVKDEKELRQFHQKTVGPLLKYDKTYHTAFLETLEAFLLENGNLQQTAQGLFLHRNTLKYRLQRVEEITGKSLKNAHDRLDLHMGITIGKFLHIV